MLTENGKRFFGGRVGTVTLNCANGSTIELGYANSDTSSVSSLCDFERLYSYCAGLYLCFGSGTTEPTKNDTTLASVINGFTHITGSNTVRGDNDSDNNRLLTHVKAVQYTGDEDIVINEVGLFFYDASYYTEVTGEVGALLAREVLNEPISMSKGDMRSFTFNIEG